MNKDPYKRLPTPEGSTLEPCPICGSAVELWQYAETETSPTTKSVMCSNGERFGPQDGLVNEGCLLFMPPDNFYRATTREAVKYWNEYAKALGSLRRKNNWANYCALREGEKP